MQLSRLSPAFDNHDILWVTTMPVEKAPAAQRDVLTVDDVSRSEPFQALLLVFRMLALVIRFRPEVTISTGAAPGIIALVASKLVGARTIWVESVANAEKLSLSGRIAGHFADLWLTQWPHIAEQHPRLKFYGRVL